MLVGRDRTFTQCCQSRYRIDAEMLIVAKIFAKTLLTKFQTNSDENREIFHCLENRNRPSTGG
jgi:hypothetical protein